MKHYKHPITGELFAYDTEAERETWGAPELVQVTDTDADVIRAQAAAAHAQASRPAQIAARLAAIDADSVRALRATVAATAKGKPVPAFDSDKLAALETEADALRAELAGLA